jgi:DNA-binding SARP family transcriptional activator
MDLRLLGPLEVFDDGRLVPLGSPRQRALLAVLGVHANEVVPASALIDEVWEDDPPQSAANLVQGYVSSLRKALGKDTIATRGTGYQLVVADDDVDARRFERLVEDASTQPPEQAAELLRRALALWRGPALADLGELQFARIEGARLDELRLVALERRIEADLALGRHVALVAELEALARRHPVREHLQRLLMLALYRSGRQSEALEAYRRARAALDELGIEPSPELRQLEQAVLRHDESLDLPAVPEDDPAPVAPETPAVAPREERKIVTVAVIELVDAGERSRGLDPEELARLHDPCVAQIREQVEVFGGVLETFIAGLGVAYFGADAMHEDDPERAVRASLAAHEAVVRLSAGLDVRIGVATGDALVRLGPAGEAAVIGDVVNVAMMLRLNAPVGAVVVADATYRETERAIEYEALGDARRAVARRWRYGFRPPRETLTPLVGREQELGLLRTALELTRRERGERLITIVGEPGIGKSRLVEELFAFVDEGPELAYWRQGRSIPYGEGVAYWALGEMIRSHAGIGETDSAEEAAGKLAASVREVMADEAEARRVEQQLGSLAGVSVVDAAAEDRAETFAAWRRFFESLAERHTTVLVFDDLHWADDGLLDFVEHLTEWATGVPLLLVCVGRPDLLERRPEWGRGARSSLLLALEPLGGDERDELATAACAAAGVGADAAGDVADLAGGSPLFTEEYARMLAEAGTAVAGESSVSAPRSVQAVIAARLDGLPLEEKAALQHAAIVGTTWWRSAVEGIGAAVPDSTLRSLERKRLIRRGRFSSLAGEAEYSFSHALVREVAYGSLPRTQRGEKHCRLAELITAAAVDRDNLVEFAAQHYLEAFALGADDTKSADVRDRARTTFRAAGDRAVALFAYPNAARFYEAALGLWPADLAGRGMLLHDLGHARGMAESGNAVDALDEAVAVLLDEGDRAGAARAAAFCGICHGFNDFAEALRRADEAIELAEDSPASPSVVYALADAAAILVASTEPERGIELGRRVVGLADELALADVAAATRLQVGFGRCQLGDLAGREEIENVVAGLEPSPRLVHALTQLAYIESEFGNLVACAELEERARSHARGFGHRHYSLMLEAKRAIELYWSGDWATALAIAEELLDDSAPSRSSLEPELRVVVGQIALARGEVERAAEEADAAVAVARAHNDPQGLRTGLGFAARAPDGSNRQLRAANELLELWARHGSMHLAGSWALDLAWAAPALGLTDDFQRVAAVTPSRTLWLEAAFALTRNEALLAVDALTSMGARPAAAQALAVAGRALVKTGERTRGAEALSRAAADLEALGATAYLQEVRELLDGAVMQEASP